MFSPNTNDELSTWRGWPPLLRTSSTKLRAPFSRLRPPVSNARLRAAGLVGRKFVGASASNVRLASMWAFLAVSGSAPGGSMSSSTDRQAAAWASRSATKNGLPFQAGSLNRRSFGSSPGGTLSPSLSHWVSVLGGTCANATARCSPTLATCIGLPGLADHPASASPS